jgi:metallo-beta-lactamase family protein
MTPATRDLLELTLFDSAKIAKMDHKKALYNKKLVEKTLRLCHTSEYNNQFRIGDFIITLRDAGHLLGSAIIEIEDSQSTGEFKKIIFSGDLGNYPEELLQVTVKPESADAVVMESTYGNRLHPNTDPLLTLQSEINSIEATGGALLIPSFAMEKTQELLHMIMHLKKDGKVSNQTPVFMDSPMAQKATDIYASYPDICNTHVQEDLQNGYPFDFPGLITIMSHKESQAIHDQPGAKVIIAGGGMMTGGRILAHSAHYLPQAINRIFFVGYQGEETLGREILEGNTQVSIDGVGITINATVSSTQGMSSHADQNQLLEWLRAIKGVKKVILTHGENDSRAALAQKITENLSITDLELPYLNQEIIL